MQNPEALEVAKKLMEGEEFKLSPQEETLILKLSGEYAAWGPVVSDIYSSRLQERALEKHAAALIKSAEASDKYSAHLVKSTEASARHAHSLTRATWVLTFATIGLMFAAIPQAILAINTFLHPPIH